MVFRYLESHTDKVTLGYINEKFSVDPKDFPIRIFLLRSRSSVINRKMKLVIVVLSLVLLSHAYNVTDIIRDWGYVSIGHFRSDLLIYT